MKKMLIFKEKKKNLDLGILTNSDHHQMIFQKFHQHKLKLISTNPNQNSISSSISRPYAPLWLTRSLTHCELNFTYPFASIAYMIHTLILNFFDFFFFLALSQLTNTILSNKAISEIENSNCFCFGCILCLLAKKMREKLHRKLFF